MAKHNLVNIGSGDGLLPVGISILSKPVLTYHKLGPVTFIWGRLSKETSAEKLLKLVWNPFI